MVEQIFEALDDNLLDYLSVIVTSGVLAYLMLEIGINRKFIGIASVLSSLVIKLIFNGIGEVIGFSLVFALIGYIIAKKYHEKH